MKSCLDLVTVRSHLLIFSPEFFVMLNLAPAVIDWPFAKWTLPDVPI